MMTADRQNKILVFGTEDVATNSFCVKTFQADHKHSAFHLCWSYPVNHKVTHIFIEGDKVAMVVGQLLCFYTFSLHGMRLVHRVHITNSFVTDIISNRGLFYIVDNTGVITIVGTNANSSFILLKHSTNRSLMRCCLLDPLTLAVSDKFGNILIYRSIFPVFSQ